MAGKFLTIEEAAELLGVSVEQVRSLVDRKKLFPMRDGTSFKFKSDEVERLAGSLGDDSSGSDALALDLDVPPAMGGAAGQTGIGGGVDDLVIGDVIDDGESVFAETSNIEAESRTVLRGHEPAAADKPKDSAAGSGLSFAEGSLLTGSNDLVLDSLIAASSPSLPKVSSGKPPAAGKSDDDDGALTLDLAAANAAGSGAMSGLSSASVAGGSIAGAALSGVLDSGLSLEDGGMELSGIDIAAASGIAGSAIGAGGSIAGEAFVLGEDVGGEDSASVVIATEETGDSSFFGAAIDDAASVTFDGDSASSDLGSTAGFAGVELAPDMSFTIWQNLGLACCALLLLLGGLVMIDLAWTIRAPNATPLSAPLLNALSTAFGWR